VKHKVCNVSESKYFSTKASCFSSITGMRRVHKFVRRVISLNVVCAVLVMQILNLIYRLKMLSIELEHYVIPEVTAHPALFRSTYLLNKNKLSSSFFVLNLKRGAT